MNFKIFFVLILLIAMIGITSAADYTNTVNSSQNVYTNKSYTMSDNSSTPFVLFILTACFGFYLLVFSIIATAEQNSDIFGYIAVPALGLATWMSRAIDVITSGGTVSTSSGIVTLESHTIYSNASITVIFIILFIISLLNVYRVIVISRGAVDEDEYTDSTR